MVHPIDGLENGRTKYATLYTLETLTGLEALQRYRRWLRVSLLTHSYIYYVLNDSIISDAKFDLLARDLSEVHKLIGNNDGYFDVRFKDWTGETGFDIVFGLPGSTVLKITTYYNLTKKVTENDR